ncbi:MAG: very short patch repair endonuclease [Geminicoccaceae bacterium]|nr:very short patch repair endonuclease [Geminicoccaceae bacterium]
MPRPVLPTDPVRSALMKRVRQKRTAPEDAVAAALRGLGIRYRRNVRTLPGSPDFANVKRGWAMFVMGCFWHHHTNCPRATVPSRNRPYWEQKFRDNRKRDAEKIRRLRALGLSVVVVWECEIEDRSDRSMEKLRALLHRRHPAKPRTGAASDRAIGG